MFEVPVNRIVPLTSARDSLSRLVSQVKGKDFFVLTKGGKPTCALVSIEYLEELTGGIKPAPIEIKPSPKVAPPIEKPPQVKPVGIKPSPPKPEAPQVSQPLITPEEVKKPLPPKESFNQRAQYSGEKEEEPEDMPIG